MRVAIASGKGGTGKTTVATGLATVLAERQPVILADLDVEEPNTRLFLTGSPVELKDVTQGVPVWDAAACSHCRQCQEVCRFGAILALADEVMVFDTICHSCYACSELCPTGALPMDPRVLGTIRHERDGNLHTIEGRLAVGREQATPLIGKVLDYVAAQTVDAPVVILDAPPGTACSMVEATRHADLVVLVTEPTPFGLHDLTLAVATMRKLDRPVQVVINRHGIGDDAVERYCAREGLPVVARIPHDRRIAEHYAEGRLPGAHVPAMRAALEDMIAAWPTADVGETS